MKMKDAIFICPTDTLYGLCASAFSKKAIKRLYTIKGRDEQKPFIILISSIEDLKKFGITINKEQKTFLQKVWPGKVSVILPVPQKKFEYLHRGKKSLAFRLPKKKLLLDLIKKIGPLVAPSANPQGERPAETIKEAKKYFSKNVDFYIAGGKLRSKPSTIVSLVTKEPKILREGSVKVVFDKFKI